MGIFARYLMGEILKVIFPVWGSLAFLLFVLEWLSQVFRIKASAATILLLYAYKVPTYLQMVFPVAVLLSILVVLGTMNRNREIVASQSFGNSLRKLMFPCFIAVTMTTVVNYWVMDIAAPWGMRNYYEMEDQKIKGVPSRFSQIRQDKIWYRNRDVLYNVGHFATDKDELYDVTIYTFDQNFQIAQTIYSKRATWSGVNWVLSDGIISITDKQLSTPVSEAFLTRSTKLIEEPKDLKRVNFNADTLGQGDLLRSIQRHRSLGINTARWEVTFHSRMSFILISFVFLMIAIPISLKYRRGAGLAKDAVIVATVSMSYWVIFNFSVNLGNMGKVHPILAAWVPAILSLGAAYYYLNTLKLSSLSE
jgi:lipopolysaccharide export system permease protein